MDDVSCFKAMLESSKDFKASFDVIELPAAGRAQPDGPRMCILIKHPSIWAKLGGRLYVNDDMMLRMLRRVVELEGGQPPVDGSQQSTLSMVMAVMYEADLPTVQECQRDMVARACAAKKEAQRGVVAAPPQ